MMYKFYYDDWYEIVDINEESPKEMNRLHREFGKWLNKKWDNGEKTDDDWSEWCEYLEEKGYKITYFDKPYEIQL